MLTEKQTQEIKQQIINQIEANFPENKKEAAKSQILSMTSEELENFLSQNNLINQNREECIFCSIASGEVNSYKIDENNDAMAVLEINPISKGHSLIIPKEHESKVNSNPEIQNLVKKVEKKLKKNLKPKKIKTFIQNLFGHSVINLLPVYKNEDVNSERIHANSEELAELQALLKKEDKQPEKAKNTLRKARKQPRKKISKEKLRLPKRIP